ncbi:MAG TPA: hypothetical protein VKY74_16930 [Chloroflexia bacterium]|nr:hypothetical protein [Chloroflexia bacterium]
MRVDDLLAYILDQRASVLRGPLGGWLAASPRFAAFVETYRDKIRKKIRGLADPESSRDLQAELATAYLLLQERRFALEYEKYGVGKQRAPDFTVTFRTHSPFNVEVTRLRPAARPPGADAAPVPGDVKLLNTLCAKIGQMPPSVPNLLVLAAEGAPYPAAEITRTMQYLKAQAAQQDDSFFLRRGGDGARAFLHHYPYLSAILIAPPDAERAPAPALLWANPEARHALPAAIKTILQRWPQLGLP